MNRLKKNQLDTIEKRRFGSVTSIIPHIHFSELHTRYIWSYRGPDDTHGFEKKKKNKNITYDG
jgi:hypothetical protein